MKMFFKRLWRSWFPQHILTVTFQEEELKIHCKEIKKLTPTKIKGIKVTGEEFEISSVKPMDYYIVEYRKDLV
jgi:hypothetical protein